jgi:hypothetical protein
MTAQQLAAKMRARAAAVEPEFRKTTRGLAVQALAFCRQKITEQIYALAIDVTKSGKKKWKRTGALRRGERVEVIDAYTMRMVNDASYALYRHEAGKPGRRKINPGRESHWRDEMVATFREILLDAYRLTVRDILKRGGL